MGSIVNQIEQYLKDLIKNSKEGIVELQRSELANLFQCAPSQINYVLNTRFSAERGYVVESRRGGGGFVRIVRLSFNSHSDLYRFILKKMGDKASQNVGEGLLNRLLEDGLLTDREARLLKRLIHRDTLQLELPMRDQLRARILQGVLLEILMSK